MLKKFGRTICMMVLPMAIVSCGGISISNPFGKSQSEGSAAYQGATKYVCANKKQFYVRMLNNQQQAWLIYPDHEVGLNQSPSEKNNYTSGSISLVINGSETTLNDGEKIAYKSCQAQK